jgi:hypothetical protein
MRAIKSSSPCVASSVSSCKSTFLQACVPVFNNPFVKTEAVCESVRELIYDYVRMRPRMKEDVLAIVSALHHTCQLS